tara:strand:- start:449 stop:1129 length:681 start_codon:yes stop_codon:yes gene_type:complete
MKVVILAGGLGTRLSEYTKNIPKPMIKIKGVPILLRIIKHYLKFGLKEFYIASGYKSAIIKNYFKKKRYNFKVKIVDTGLNTMTGGRVLRLKKYLKSETFLLTYGDGLSDVNINKLINFHKKTKNFVTLTAVRPPARFGAIKLHGNRVKVFREKSRLDEGWINGGFFVMSPKIFKFIKSDKSYLEREPLERISKKNKLGAYKHNGFWQCMDTLRDKKILEKKVNKY